MDQHWVSIMVSGRRPTFKPKTIPDYWQFTYRQVSELYGYRHRLAQAPLNLVS
jgi:hypothetical protein